MKIQSVKLENLTIFKNLTVDMLEGINIFIGKNGTGKTHLLKAIYGACETSKEKSPFAFNFLRCFQQNSEIINLFHDRVHGTFSVDLNVGNFTHEIDSRKNTILMDKVDNIWGGYYINLPKDDIFNATYIPVKDMLTHSKGFNPMAEKYDGEFPFDKTLIDIINRASQWKLKKIPNIAKLIVPVIGKIIDGEVILQNEEFFIKKHNGQLINFSVEAEGLKKIGLLWQLIMNENITEDSILIWDEPEANINPDFIPDIVECLLELSRHNTQIFVSTHNYLFAKYFDVRRKETDSVRFHSLYKETPGSVQVESKAYFDELEHNDILKSFDKLLDEVYELNEE